MSVKILGTGSFLPEKSVSNDDLSKVMDTSDEWISSRTGIRSRHISIEDTTSTMAVKAAKKALEDAGISAEELDHIFVVRTGERIIESEVYRHKGDIPCVTAQTTNNGITWYADEKWLEKEHGKSIITDDLLQRGKISKTNLKDLKELGVLDKLNESNQLSLFDFM